MRGGVISALMASLIAAGVAPLRSQEALMIEREFVLPTPGLGVANAIVELEDGGFVAVGYADAGGATGTDVVLVRFDSAGDTLWTRTYGGEREEFGWDVVARRDGGFLVAGFAEAPSAGREDVLVLGIDAAGVLLWERSFGGPGRDRAWSLAMAPDGEVVIAAETEEIGGARHRDAYLVRLDGRGREVWARTIEAPGDQRIYHVVATEDGAFVATGTTGPNTSRDNRDVYVVRIAGDGEVAWVKTFGDAADDVGHGVLALPGGDVLITGYGASRSRSGTDVYLIRLDPSGELVWWKHDGGPTDDRAMMSASRSGGGFVTIGFSWTSAETDIVIVESDSEGVTQTRTAFDRPGGDRGVMVLEAGGGGYVVAGTMEGSDGGSGDFAILWLE